MSVTESKPNNVAENVKKEENNEFYLQYDEAHSEHTYSSFRVALKMYQDEALKTGKAPLFFHRGKLSILLSEDGNPVVVELKKGRLTGIITKFGGWKAVGEGSKKRPKTPPKTVLDMLYQADKDIINDTVEIVPVIKTIQYGCVVDADWNIWQKRGYMPSLKVWMNNDYEFEPIPDTVTQAGVDDVKKMLWDIFGDFLFKDKKDGEESINYQNTILALTTAIIRPMWKWALPAIIINKNEAGTGGTLLSELIVGAAYGDSEIQIRLNTYTFPDMATFKDGEFDKQLKTALHDNKPYYITDNITPNLKWTNNTLLTILTGAGGGTVRILGKTESVSGGEKTLWIFNGININIEQRDITRRIIPIELGTDKTTLELGKLQRKHTKEELKKLVYDNHPKIIRGMVILHKWWEQNGRPKAGTLDANIEEYQTWYDEIVAMLDCAGYKNILKNLGELQTQAEEEDYDGNIALFFDALYDEGKKVDDKNKKYQISLFTVAEVDSWIAQEIRDERNGLTTIENTKFLQYLPFEYRQGKKSISYLFREKRKRPYSKSKYILLYDDHQKDRKRYWYLRVREQQDELIS